MACRKRLSLPLVAWLILRVDAQNTTDAIVGWQAGPDTRGTFMLVWSCLITMFTCTWAVLHLNVPGRDEGAFKTLGRKIKWMVINILFPELVLSKAICDLRLALGDLREFDHHLLTAASGPITWEYPGPESPAHLGRHKWTWEVRYPKYYGILCWLIRWLAGERPTRSETDNVGICPEKAPTSKASRDGGPAKNAESKLRHKRQKWTLVHSYYAQMGGLVYYQHLGKSAPKTYYALTPAKLQLLLQEPYRIQEHGHPLRGLVLEEKHIKDKSNADWLVKGLAILQITWIVLSVIARHISGLPITQLEIATIAFAIMATWTYLANWWKPKEVSQPTIIHTLASLDGGQSRMQSLSDELRLRPPTKDTEAVEKSDSHQHPGDYERVPNDLVQRGYDTVLMYTLISVSSLIFGGLHCLAWNFEFPTRTELVCWRVASLTSATVPTVALALNLIFNHLLARPKSRLISELCGKLCDLDHLPQKWWEHLMQGPSFSSSDIGALMAIAAAPAGSRNWEERPSDEAIQKARKRRDLDHAYHFAFLGSQCKRFQRLREHILEDNNTIIYQYSLLRDDWVQNEDKIWRDFQQNQKDKDAQTKQGLDWDHGAETEEVRRARARCKWLPLWRDYEEFVRHKLDVSSPQPPYASYLEQLVQAFGEANDQAKNLNDQDLDNRLEEYRRTCTILTISSVIIYAAARLIIIVLLFTCLRATPVGVYQITPWTKFVPFMS